MSTGETYTVYSGCPPHWIEQAEAVVAENFPGISDVSRPILGVDDQTIIAPNLAASLDPANGAVVSMVLDGSNELCALAQAFPISTFDHLRAEQDVAYLYLTVVGWAHQGNGLSSFVLDGLLRQLQPKFKAVESHFMVTTRGVPYADATVRKYGEAVTVLDPDYDPWGAGLQRPLRFDLVKYFANGGWAGLDRRRTNTGNTYK